MVRPGETIEIEVELTERLADAFFLEGQGDLRRQSRPSDSISPAPPSTRCEAQVIRQRTGSNRRIILKHISSVSFVSSVSPSCALYVIEFMDFLQLAGKSVLVFGVANRKSVAWHIGQVLAAAGAKVVYVVRHAERRERASPSLSATRRSSLRRRVRGADRGCATRWPPRTCRFHGLRPFDRLRRLRGRHGCQTAPPFHETPKRAFLRAVDISCYSLIALSNALKDLLEPDASVVDDLDLDHADGQRKLRLHGPDQGGCSIRRWCFWPRSFSRFSQVRFNAVAPGLLKTSASAGIPGYVDSYLYAEQATLRKQAVATEEVARTAAFLLSLLSPAGDREGHEAAHGLLPQGP